MRQICVCVLGALLCASACAESWSERMWKQVNHKLTLELVDTKLSEACDIVSRITGLTIIIAPTLRAADPSFSLKVNNMDAGTVIKWFTVMTDSYADVENQAIYITDKEDNRNKDAQDRADLQLLAAEKGIVAEVAPDGPVTREELLKVALQIMEKEQPKIPDFPGPGVGFGGDPSNPTFIFTKQD